MSLLVSPRVRKSVRFFAAFFYSLIALALLLGLLPGVFEAVFRRYDMALEQPFSDRARGQFEFIRHHLNEPFDGYGVTQVLAPVFDVVALSHMGCGLLNVTIVEPSLKDQVAPLIGEIVRRAISPQVSPYGVSPEIVTSLGDHGLYLSHLNLILGCYRQVSGNTQYDELHGRISAHLARGSLADGDFHIRSFPQSAKWPADQTVTLCSLYLCDKTRGTDLSVEPIRGWLAYMKDKATDSATQLPRSCISDLWYASMPRGCALSWSALYMAQFAPDAAAELYCRSRMQYFKTVLGCGGFREWPVGSDHGMNADSGPILFGIGVSASGLGVGPARLFKDYEKYTQMMRAASVCGAPTVLGPERKYRFSPLLGEAILFHGETAVPWFAPMPATSFPKSTSFPTGPLILLVCILAALGLLAKRIQKLLRQGRPK
ncbi:MAG: hypothetical protein K8R23_10720 [Chthoniobacter sp.]|nr:hypothetical protein [Chthoniobacter sp.]